MGFWLGGDNHLTTANYWIEVDVRFASKHQFAPDFASQGNFLLDRKGGTPSAHSMHGEAGIHHLN